MAAARLRRPERQREPNLRKPRSLLTGDMAEGYMFSAALAMIFLMALLVRLWVVKDLSVGMWADSYHHTMISQLLVDNGGLFNSWEPYAPLSSFTYHFGFHSLVAFYYWLTGVPVTKSVLLVGQIINTLAVPLMYLLTRRLTGSRWAGLTAALVVGFLSSMPMYYVNWGRYTQLAGQTILPVLMLLSVESTLGKERDWRVMVPTVVALAGLMLTHYRVTIMFLCFAFPLLLCATATAAKGESRREMLGAWLRFLVIAVTATMVVSPWAWNSLHGHLVGALLSFSEKAERLSSLTYLRHLLVTGDILFFLGVDLIALSSLGAWLGIVRRKRGAMLICAWLVALLLVAVSDVLYLPTSSALNLFTVLLALYIPASVLSGFALSRAVSVVGDRMLPASQLVAVLSLAIVLLTFRDTANILEPANVFVTDRDEQAMRWIRDHTDPSAKFLVSFSFWDQASVVLGTDAGWWIPLLAERSNTLPPMSYPTEITQDPDLGLKVRAFAAKIEESLENGRETVGLLAENGVTHVYIGARGGNLQPEFFVNNPCYDAVYHENRVWIFEVVHTCVT